MYIALFPVGGCDSSTVPKCKEVVKLNERFAFKIIIGDLDISALNSAAEGGYGQGVRKKPDSEARGN